MQTVTDDPPRPAPRPSVLDVEIVIPVYNEERTLAAAVYRLHDFLSRHLPLAWQITIADNASTDLTPEIAQALTDSLDRVHMLRLERKGRGRALRAAWSASPARVVAYMDVDLSTDLRALPPLLAPLLSGHSQVAIGSRLAAGSRVTRGAKREVISRAYNLILHTVLRAKFSDAQCGFKAVRADAAGELLPAIRDVSWFFDTELLVLAQRRGMRIHEVAVDWVDDPDSRVDIVSTALADLRGVGRLALAAPITRFLGIGIASTLAYALLFLALAGLLGSALASAAALALTAVANTAANRRLTFGVRGRAHLGRHHLAGLIVFLIALGLTNGALDVLHGLDPHPARLLEAAVLVVASLAATVTRYFALATWVFRRPGTTPPAPLPAHPL
ncbi:MAG: glycosyltransferase [Solirubrobacterales bacterium]|nr:glycosyltransferase [Solirubrobacterales bacterium]